MKLAPSILSADLLNLEHAVEQCLAGGSDLVHFDVMDGLFVPNLTFGIPILQAMAKKSRLPIDVHLMVEQPDRLLDQYLDAGAAWISVHWEAASHLHRTLGRIREGGARAGVALNPTTPVELLADTLPSLDFVVLMSVNPGFSGQSFIPQTLDKVRRLRAMIDERELEVEIELDGGVGPGNVREVVAAGVDICVAGSAVFGTSDPVAAMGLIRRSAAQETL